MSSVIWNENKISVDLAWSLRYAYLRTICYNKYYVVEKWLGNLQNKWDGWKISRMVAKLVGCLQKSGMSEK